MPNYENGKIYELNGTNDDGIKLTYYGSTTLKLCQRLAQHKDDFKNDRSCSSKEVLKCLDYRINLLELYPCKCKDELKARERFYSDNNECVNVRKPILFAGEKQILDKKYHKEYDKQHKEQKKEYNKQHKEQKNEYQKEYNKQHKEQIKAYNKQWYINRKVQKLELELMSKEDINVM
jgi:hypothetical protein